MRKLIFASGAIVLIAITVFVWSRTALVSTHASTKFPINIGPAAAQAGVMVSPFDMMMNHKGALPMQSWDAI